MVELAMASEKLEATVIRMEYLIDYHSIKSDVKAGFSVMLGDLLTFYRERAFAKFRSRADSERAYTRRISPDHKMGQAEELSERDCYCEALINLESELSLMPDVRGAKDPFSKINWWNEK